MQLTTRTTETLVRRFASAGHSELDQCSKDLKAIYSDIGQKAEVRLIAKEFASVVRKQLRRD